MQKELRDIWRSWEEDLAAARDLDGRQRERVGFIVRWYVGCLERIGRLPGRGSARTFWRGVVLSKEREAWQREQWESGMRWYLDWLDLVKREEGMEPAPDLAQRVYREVPEWGGQLGVVLGVSGTEIYTHVAEGGTRFGVISPLDE